MPGHRATGTAGNATCTGVGHAATDTCDWRPDAAAQAAALGVLRRGLRITVTFGSLSAAAGTRSRHAH